MALVSHFSYLDSGDAAKPSGLWSWAKRLIDALNRWKLFNLMDVPLADKPLYKLRINADGTDFEFAPDSEASSSLDSLVLTGHAHWSVRVNSTGDALILEKEVLFSLIGASLTGKAHQRVSVNAGETDFVLEKDIMESLRGVSLTGLAGHAVVVNSTEDGYSIAP
jgi:hypothetical protein